MNISNVINLVSVAVSVTSAIFAARQANVANRIAQEQLDEAKKPKLGIVTQLESISRSIRHLDDTVEKLKKIDNLNNQ